jgi:hypothetical protein
MARRFSASQFRSRIQQLQSQHRPFTAPIYANLFEGDAATGEGNLCSQTSIDCWAEMPAVAPCDDAVVTEGMRGLARSPAA